MRAAGTEVYTVPTRNGRFVEGLQGRTGNLVGVDEAKHSNVSADSAVDTDVPAAVFIFRWRPRGQQQSREHRDPGSTESCDNQSSPHTSACPYADRVAQAGDESTSPFSQTRSRLWSNLVRRSSLQCTAHDRRFTSIDTPHTDWLFSAPDRSVLVHHQVLAERSGGPRCGRLGVLPERSLRRRSRLAFALSTEAEDTSQCSENDQPEHPQVASPALAIEHRNNPLDSRVPSCRTTKLTGWPPVSLPSKSDRIAAPVHAVVPR